MNATLDVTAIRSALTTERFGRDLRYLPQIDSTNRAALALPAAEWQTGTTLITDHQIAGRGRRGRTWVAPPGTALLMTVLVRPPGVAPLGDLIQVASLAVVDAIHRTSGLEPRLKWPNDVLIHGRKVCGILVEHQVRGADERVAIGIGINVSIPAAILEDLPGPATTLELAAARRISREELAAGLCAALETWYYRLDEDANAVFASWRSLLDTVPAPVRVTDASGTWSGQAVDVLRDGALVVITSQGERKVLYAADVSIREDDCLQAP